MNNVHLAVQFFLQLAVILLFCRLVGAIAVRLGQPQVVAEMLAGVLLGPSLFGLLWPEAQQWLFPVGHDAESARHAELSFSRVAARAGALHVRRRDGVPRGHRAAAVEERGRGIDRRNGRRRSCLGAALAWIFFHHTELFPKKTTLREAMLFLGASMCITAFPMLARIIHFKKLTGTTMGTVALGAGAIDDATAWCLLAVVLASFDNNWSHALVNIGGGVAYVAVVSARGAAVARTAPSRGWSRTGR